MTHFRGQIRGPHWGPTMDNMLIDFWRRHDCLFNSSSDSYYDKDLKTRLWGQFALSVGKSVSEVERRSRSLRTQYGRVMWHPERVCTPQQEMLREKLAFLKPYIVRRRAEAQIEESDRGEDMEELETEGSIDQEVGISSGGPPDADVAERDLDDEPRCSNPQPRVAGVMSLNCPHHCPDDGATAPPDFTATMSQRDVLSQFAEVMLADMRHIRDPVALMRLRRDITDLVFKAVEEDERRWCVRAPSLPGPEERSRSCCGPQEVRSQTNCSWRFLRRRNKRGEAGRRTQRWEDVKHTRRASRSQFQAIQQTPDGPSDTGSQVSAQVPEMKREVEPRVIKIEEEDGTLPLV